MVCGCKHCRRNDSKCTMWNVDCMNGAKNGENSNQIMRLNQDG